MKRATYGMCVSRLNLEISIHALVKRATRFLIYIIAFLCISIHALVKRATIFTQVRYNIDNISIHALVKRATSASAGTAWKIMNFNPRPREEGDLYIHNQKE